MGRVIRTEVIGVRCELATPRGLYGAKPPRCNAYAAVSSVAPTDHLGLLQDLSRLVAGGWAFLMGSQLRAYCPEHAERVSSCSCQLRASRVTACPVHGAAADQVWSADVVPTDVRIVLTRSRSRKAQR